MNALYVTRPAKPFSKKKKSKHSKLPKGMPKLRRRTAADALKISNNNDPVYNLKQMFESRASRRTFDEAGMGLQGRNFYYSSSRLPLPGSLGRIDNTPMLTLNNLGRNSMFMDLQRASKRLPPTLGGAKLGGSGSGKSRLIASADNARTAASVASSASAFATARANEINEDIDFGYGGGATDSSEEEEKGEISYNEAKHSGLVDRGYGGDSDEDDYTPDMARMGLPPGRLVPRAKTFSTQHMKGKSSGAGAGASSIMSPIIQNSNSSQTSMATAVAHPTQVPHSAKTTNNLPPLVTGTPLSQMLQKKPSTGSTPSTGVASAKSMGIGTPGPPVALAKPSAGSGAKAVKGLKESKGVMMPKTPYKAPGKTPNRAPGKGKSPYSGNKETLGSATKPTPKSKSKSKKNKVYPSS